MLYLSDYLAKGRLSFDLVFPFSPDSAERSRPYLICGEYLNFLITIRSNSPELKLDRYVDKVATSLESFQIYPDDHNALEAGQKSGLLRMQSVESLVSLRSQTSQGSVISTSRKSDDLTEEIDLSRLVIEPAKLVNAHLIVIPMFMHIDSDIQFNQGLAQFEVSITERITIGVVDSLFFTGSQKGSQPLKKLICNETKNLSTFVFKPITKLQNSIRILRPISASIKVVSLSPSFAALNLNFQCNSNLNDSTVSLLNLKSELVDLGASLIRTSKGKIFSQDSLLLRPIVEDEKEQFPLTLGPSEIFSTIHSLRLIRNTLPSELQSQMMLRSIIQASVSTDPPINVTLSFESEIDLLKLFPTPTVEDVDLKFILEEPIVQANRPFPIKILLTNETKQVRSMQIRFLIHSLFDNAISSSSLAPPHSHPLLAANALSSSLSLSNTTPTHNIEELVKSFANLESNYPAFLPLTLQLNFDTIRPGTTQEAIAIFLPLRVGHQILGNVQVVDLINQRNAQLNHVLEIFVQS